MPKSRLSVRLNAERLEHLERHCQATGDTVTRVVWQALDAFLASNGASGPKSAPARRLSPPAAVIPLTTGYFASAGGDPRAQLRSLFTQLLAVSFASKQLFPRTKGPAEVYQALLPLVGLSEWLNV